jgi:hypothetical protein
VELVDSSFSALAALRVDRRFPQAGVSAQFSPDFKKLQTKKGWPREKDIPICPSS